MPTVKPACDGSLMPNYRRPHLPGATYFFTVVTARRRPFLTQPASIQALRASVAEVRSILPFDVVCWVVLPEHMHAMWTMPAGDGDYSTRWGRIKAGFTRRCGLEHVSGHQRYGGLWQPRFWEHAIRDEDDARRHMDYVHYNPVKHGLAGRVRDWPWSSFHRCVERGWYPRDWGVHEPEVPTTRCGE